MVFGVLLDIILVYICVAIVSTIIIVSSVIFKILTSSSSKKFKIIINESILKIYIELKNPLETQWGFLANLILYK